jgi:hypothetical protein
MAVFARYRLLLLSAASVLGLGGCLMTMIPEESESSIIITRPPRDAMPHLISAMKQFSVAYDYQETSSQPGLAMRRFKARMTFWGIGGAPHYNDRPYFIDIFRHPDGRIFVRYQGKGDVRTNDNPVISDLKTLLTRHVGSKHIAYQYTPAHWRLVTMGGN